MQEYSYVFVVLMGLGTVFFGLIFLIILTDLMGYILKGRLKKENLASSGKNVETNFKKSQYGDIDIPMIVAIATAIAEDLGGSVSGIRIRSIRKL